MNPLAQSPAQSGWYAHLKLGFEQQGQRTVLAHRQRQGPLSIQRALYPEGPVCHAYLLHPPGGVVGGDRLQIDVAIDSGHALITTPGATKFYRSNGMDAVQQQTLSIADNATLEWLPQETILFPGAQVNGQTRIELKGKAKIAAWEILCFGRPSNDEPFRHGRACFGFEIWRDGRPLLLEKLRVSAESLAHRSLFNQQPVVATFILSGCNQQTLDQARSNADKHLALTLIEDLLIVRYLGASTEQAQQTFRQLWCLLRPEVLNTPTHLPRIWST